MCIQPSLKPLPSDVAKQIDDYNKEVDTLLTAFLEMSTSNQKLQVYTLLGSLFGQLDNEI